MLRQNLRVRKFVMGEYDTKSAGDRDLAKVPNPVPDDWDATVKRQVSLVLQPTNSLVYPKNDFKCTPDFALRTSDARINFNDL